MSTPDPFAAFESERTVIKPKPRMPGSGGSPPPATPGLAPAADALPLELGTLGLLNPLVSAAAGLLVLMGKLRHLVQPPHVATLRASTAEAVQRFEAEARRTGASNESVLAARYILCTALDEAVANTPWGVQGGWNKQSLLVQFHNETWGGEKVFQLLARLAQDVPQHRSLLELLYAVLALGFEGRYRVIDNGKAQLDTVRQRLAELIRKDRPPLEPALSPHWRGQGAVGRALRDAVPLWVVGAALLLLLALTWFGLRLWLGQQSDQTWSQLAGLRMPQVAIALPPPVQSKVPRLAGFLEPEVQQGLLTVTDEADRSTVRLRGDAFFGSGSADPMVSAMPVLVRIGQALAQVQGQVLIAGHSDSQPIRSLRFPSNWHLSTARAEAVKTALSPLVDAARMKADGKADAEPVAPNDTPANRARNRRVEVVLLVPPAPTATPLATANAPGAAR